MKHGYPFIHDVTIIECLAGLAHLAIPKFLHQWTGLHLEFPVQGIYLVTIALGKVIFPSRLRI